MAKTRHANGQYTGHCTPGDGTGFTHFPPKRPYDILEDVTSSSGPNAEQTGGAPESVNRDSPPRGGKE